MVVIVTTRFNDSTWEENRSYRERHDIACIYGPSQQMSPKIAPDSLVIVIEMNNSVNQIVGISLIRNTVAYDKYYGIYNYGHYNTYIYKGKYRVDRITLVEKHPKLVQIYDQILFKGKTHLKRGTGFTTIPDKLLRHPLCSQIDLVEETKKIFKGNQEREPRFP